jgi:hypothetical protein
MILVYLIEHGAATEQACRDRGIPAFADLWAPALTTGDAGWRCFRLAGAKGWNQTMT